MLYGSTRKKLKPGWISDIGFRVWIWFVQPRPKRSVDSRDSGSTGEYAVAGHRECCTFRQIKSHNCRHSRHVIQLFLKKIENYEKKIIILHVVIGKYEICRKNFSFCILNKIFKILVNSVNWRNSRTSEDDQRNAEAMRISYHWDKRKSTRMNPFSF